MKLGIGSASFFFNCSVVQLKNSSVTTYTGKILIKVPIAHTALLSSPKFYGSGSTKSFPFSGAKYDATSASVTAESSAGLHRGELSLSTNTERTPS